MLGEFIRSARLRRHWSQAVLAEKSGVAQTYISGLERGQFDNPSMDVLRGLAEALDVSVDDLVTAAAAIPTVSPEQIATYLQQLKALGVGENILAQLAARQEYLTQQDWEDFLRLAGCGQEEDPSSQQTATEPDQGGMRGGSYQSGQVEANSTAIDKARPREPQTAR